MSAALFAQIGPTRSTMVRATGEAVVPVVPDRAVVRLALMTTARTAERAREKNAKRTTAMVAKLREVLGQDATIGTANYYLNKNYDGFVANDTIDVQVGDPANAGKVIDVATKAGASVVRGVDVSTMDDQSARSEALRQATSRAQTNAEAMAAALGMRVERVVSAETSAQPAATPPGLAGPSLPRKKSVPTPLPVGPIEIRAQATVTLEAVPGK